VAFIPQLRGWGKEAIHRVQKQFSLRGIESRTPTFVYQMGKVGSSTVVRTLERLREPSPVVHVHSLNSSKVREDVEALRESLGYLREHVITSLTLVRKQLDWRRFPCKVITLTREPVGRAVSFAFQDWKRQLPEVSSLDELRSEQMVELVMEKLKPGSPHANPKKWFEGELKSVFGVNVLTTPYDFEQGYVVIRSGPVDVLVIRMEDLNRSLQAGLAELYDLDHQDIRMRNANVGSAKKYADLLSQVKEQLTLPPSVSERVFTTDYAMHFYGPDLDRLRDKWTEHL
jgi:hypothetical protein